MPHSISLGLTLAVIWMLLSGHSEPLLVGLGIASVAFAAFLAKTMDVVERDSLRIHLGWKLPIYWAWLFWEIAKANVAVARVILTPAMPIRPRVIDVVAGQKSDLGRVTYANSITLTPGTVTIDTDDSHLGVHALTEEAAADLMTGEMDRHVSRLEIEGRAEDSSP